MELVLLKICLKDTEFTNKKNNLNIQKILIFSDLNYQGLNIQNYLRILLK